MQTQISVESTSSGLPLHVQEREEQREAFRQEGRIAWEEYQQNGLHLTNAETRAWLEELAAGNDVEPPACHR